MTAAPRKILVTGSSGSLGAQFVETFLTDGHAVVGFDIAPPTSDPGATSPDTAALGGAWRFVKCDVSDPASIEQALAQVQDVFPFDIVFNNAGIAVGGPIAEMNPSDWEWTSKFDLSGPTHGGDAFLPPMTAQKHRGHLLLTAPFPVLGPH